MAELLYKDEVYNIVGAAMDVFNTLGSGFLEPVYQEALECELADRNIPFRPQQELQVSYKNHKLQKWYIADLVIFDKIIVELKAIDWLTSHEDAQVINYLKATGLELALLINFGASSLEWKRMVLSHSPIIHSRKISEIRG